MSIWTFPVLLNVFLLTVLPASWIVSAISSGLWQWSRTSAHILIQERTIPEIDTLAYIAWLIIAVCIAFITTSLLRHFKTHRSFLRVVSWVNYSLLSYLILTAHLGIIGIATIHPLPLLTGLIIGSVACFARWPLSIQEIVASCTALIYSIAPVVSLDIGTKKLYTVDGYLRYGVPRALFAILTVVLLLSLRRFVPIRRIAGQLTRRRIILIISLIVLFLLTQLMAASRLPSDIFFTMLPAYYATHGSTLLVDVMSQYGLLYLAPWMVWFLLFPNAPVSFAVGTIISAGLLFIYFCVYFGITNRIIRRNSVFVMTAIASFYLSVFVRFTGVSDGISVVSTPAFTPLRFGMFILPLWFLIRFSQTHSERYIDRFLIVSSVLFFYSFETGAVLIAAGLITAMIRALTRNNAAKVCMRYLMISMLTVCLGVGILIVYALLFSGKFPDFSMYWELAGLYGSGFLTRPVGDQTAGYILLAVFIGGAVIGIRKIVHESRDEGIIFVYLALIGLASFPYYTGRSMHQTIYSISLPFVLLCALLLEYAAGVVSRNMNRFSAWAVLVACGIVLMMGWERGVTEIGRSAYTSPVIIRDAYRHVRRAFAKWDIIDSPQYAFLSNHLPRGCQLISFDEREFELGPALGVSPAFQYPFVYGFITTKEQVDSLRTKTSEGDICMFVSDRFRKVQDPFSWGMYRYFVFLHADAMRQHAQDLRFGYTLFTLPANEFLTQPGLVQKMSESRRAF